MVNEYEDLILPPPPQFRDGYKPFPAPRLVQRPVPAPGPGKRPVPAPRTKLDQALKGHVESFEVGFESNRDPLVQLQTTRKAIEFCFKASLEK